MKATILLVCLSAVTIINAKHTQDWRSSDKDIFIENRGKFVKTGVEYDQQGTQYDSKHGSKQGGQEKQNFPAQFGSYSQSEGRKAAPTGIDALKKQGFLLAVLVNVNEPSIEEQLEQLGQTLIANEQMYDGNLDDDMEQVLQLTAVGKMLGKQDTFDHFNVVQLQQMIGLYKLLARASDWDTFQRNVCFARQNLNDEVFIGALLAAVKQRPDTADLIMPAINELLPEQFYDQRLIQQIKNIQPNDLRTSTKPQYSEILGGYQPRQQQQPRWGGRQAMKTWQEWRQERLQKQSALGITNTGWGNQQKLVLPLNVEGQQSGSYDLSQRISYLTKDVGFNNFWYSFSNGIFSRMHLQAVQNQESDVQFGERAEYKPSQGMSSQASRSQQFLSAPQETGPLLYSPRRGWHQRQQESSKYTDDQSTDPQYGQTIFGKSASTQKSQSSVYQGYGIGSYDEDRLLKTNRRRFYPGFGQNIQGGYETIEQQSDESTNSQQDSDEAIGQDSDETKQKDSDERTEIWERHILHPQRLLKVNRRRQNQKDVQFYQKSGQQSNIAGALDSDEIFGETDDESSGSGKQGSIAIQGERLLKENRRRMNQKTNAYQSNEGIRQANRKSIFKIFGTHSKAGIKYLLNQEEKRKFSSSQEDSNGLQKYFGRIGNQKSSKVSGEEDEQRESNRQQHTGCPNSQEDSYKRPSFFQTIGYQKSSEDDRKGSSEQGGYHQSTSARKQYAGYSNSQEDSNQGRRFFQILPKEEYSSQENYVQGGGDSSRMLTVGRRRVVRDISGQYRQNDNLAESRLGEVIIANIQQVFARLQMEQLSHQLEDVLDRNPKLVFKQKQHQKLQQKKWQQQQSKQQRDQAQVDYNSIQGFTKLQDLETQQIEQILGTKRLLKSILQEELQLLLSQGEIDLEQTNILDIIGKILTNQESNTGVDVLNVWEQLFQKLKSGNEQYSKEPAASLSNTAKQLQQPSYEYILKIFLELANDYSELLPSYDDDDLLLHGIQLNDLKVDKLQTYFDTADVDLTNALDRAAMMQQDVDQSNIKVTPTGRQQRLNHKSFSLKYDVSATQPRRVVIRTFLGPKLDTEGNELSLDENRRNFILLDAFTSSLSQGRNTIKRKSSDFEWTSQDATPLALMYKQVMQGIQSGSGGVQLDRFNPNNCHFPQRLLLPRGLPNGLPMQLFVIITSVTQQDALLQQQQQQQQQQKHETDNICGMGIAAIALDTQPVGFPLDRKIDNVQNLLVPNAILKDVTIYHGGHTNVQNIGAWPSAE